jgi:hypothetical protein
VQLPQLADHPSGVEVHIPKRSLWIR